MKLVGLIALLMISLSAFASDSNDQQLAVNLMRAQMPAQSKIRIALLMEGEKNGISSITGFQVDWKSLECHAAASETAIVGTCFVPVTSSQINSEFAVTLGIDGIQATALSLDLLNH